MGTTEALVLSAEMKVADASPSFSLLASERPFTFNANLLFPYRVRD